jgi:hypothetical protein
VCAPAATTEVSDLARAVDRRRLALGALMLASLALQLGTAVTAQEPARGEALTERLRQIQGQAAPDATEPTRDGAAREQELIERLEAVQRGPESTPSTGAGPMLGEDKVRGLIGQGLGVEVLNIEAIESEGRPAYAVTVMSPAGNVNGAFAVEILLVDGATGALLGRVPQAPRTAAPGLTASPGRAAPDTPGLEIRRRTYR